MDLAYRLILEHIGPVLVYIDTEVVYIDAVIMYVDVPNVRNIYIYIYRVSQEE
jgi:hypothetical protein